MGILIKEVLFPLHEYMKGHSTMTLLRELEMTQWRERGEIGELQRVKLKSFLKFIKEHVPFYKDMTIPEGDLSRIIPLTKQDIRNGSERMRSDAARAMVSSSTGGSTGEPLMFYLGRRRISADIAAKVRAQRWWDVDIGDREVAIWGSPIELSRQDRLRQLRDRIFRTRLLSAFDMTGDRMCAYLKFIRRFRPLQVFGYANAIYLLCKYAMKRNIKLDDVGVKVVFTTAEQLYDHQRELISETFSAPLANSYGGRDAGFIAQECPHGRMHVADDNIVVEITDAEGRPLPPGERGEILVTHLESHDFPFVRYKTGDIGIKSEESCPCGRGLSILKSIEGRCNDLIVTSGGKVMHGAALIYIIRVFKGIEEFKVLQEDRDSFKLYLVVNEHFNEGDVMNIKEGMGKRLGMDARIDIIFTDRISRDRSGKFRYIESMVGDEKAASRGSL